MDYRLVIVRGRSGAQAIELADGVTTVGRHDDCQLRIKSSQVSRKHCELFEKKGLLLVKDLGSSNGTFVNGQKVDGQRVLEAGDELTIGQVKLRVVKISATATATSAPAAPAAQPEDTAMAATADEATPPFNEPADFDTSFEPSAPAGDDFDIESFEESEGKTPAPPQAKEVLATTATKPSAPPSPPPPEPETAVAEDAVADFLLDIKFDDDDH